MFVLKVLNGPLYGAEVVLPAGSVFIRAVLRVDDEPSVVCEGDLPDPQVLTLSIPVAEVSPNFRLTLPEQAGSHRARAEVFDQLEGPSERELAINEPIRIGAMRLALKPHDTAWSDAVRQHRERPQDAVRHGAVGALRPGATPRRRAIASVFAAGAAIMLSMGVWHVAGASAPSAEPASVFSGPSWQVVERDAFPAYVIARNEQAALQARQALRLAAPAHPFVVRSLKADIEQVREVLRQMRIPYFSIDLANASVPRVVLRKDPGVSTTARRQALIDAVRAVLPYAQSVVLQVSDGSAALQGARERLAALHIRARLTLSAEHLLIDVADHLSDEQLFYVGELGRWLRSEWGDDFAKLTVRQHDAVAARSLMTGARGYELLGRTHIAFP